ncbi:MAG TPA: hypothetical protein VFE96_07815, partial [Candidatus Bathyarchaeia archaeon]|nr:hypothetical protein [Candidatus Bathyarchaeia archaeon]
MSDTRLGYIAVVFLLLSVLLGVASTTYGYVLYNRITVYNPPYMEVDFPDRTWVVGLSLFWTLSPGDKVNLSMEFDPRIDPSSI